MNNTKYKAIKDDDVVNAFSGPSPDITNHYQILSHCGNCTFRGDIWILMGVTVYNTLCPNCECNTLKIKSLI